MNATRFPIAALLGLLALTSCEKQDSAAPTPGQQLAARWQLARVDDAATAASSYSGASGAYIEFMALGTSTVGLGPCNNFSGRFTVGQGGELHISTQIPTRVGCPAQALETQYLTNLALTTRYEISGDELRLYDGTAAPPRLVFQRVAQ